MGSMTEKGSAEITLPRFGVRPIQAVIFICLLLSSFIPEWMLSAVMISAVLLMAADPFACREERVLMPGAGLFILILGVGLAGSSGKAAYDIAKDAWYVGNALLALLFGYLLQRRAGDIIAILQTVAVAAVLVSSVHATRFLMDPWLLHQSLADIRAQAGTGFLISALGVALALGDLRFRLGIFRTRWIPWAIVAPCMASIVLSLSRTAWVVLLTLAVVTALNVSFRALRRIAVAVVPAVLLMIMTFGFVMVDEGPAETSSFFQKVTASLKEVRVAEYDSKADINRYWRGFESHRAIQEYASGSLIERMLGKGFGSFVDLGFVMSLDDEELDRIPILHNGYLYLLVKTGVAGLAAYMLYLVLLLARGKFLTAIPDAMVRFSGLLLIALTIVMIETTFVIAGMFNKNWLYPATVLIGVLLGYSESIRRKESDRRARIAAAVGAA